MAARYPALRPAESLLDLQNGWDETPRPSSSHSASTSSTSRSVTPTQAVSSPTSYSPWSPQSPQTTRSPPVVQPSNPWFAASNAKKHTPTGSPESRTPQYASRSTTPVAAPQPVRPTNAIVGLNQSTYAVQNGDVSPPRSVTSPMPSQYRQSSFFLDLQTLERVFITRAVAQTYLQYYPSLLVRIGVSQESKNNAYHWACRNPLVALLLLLCEDVAAFPRAYFYSLSDEQLPFAETDLHCIATDPQKVMHMQWRVLVKNLPRDGTHTTFTRRERAPLLHQGQIVSSDVSGATVDRVRVLGDTEGKVYVRKGFTCEKPEDHDALIRQIQSFSRFNHTNMAKILCSYTEGLNTAFLVPQAQCNLDDYLRAPHDSTRSRHVLDWINDLTQAVAYVHAQPKKPAHRNIRPDKILVTGSKIYLSVFGIYAQPDADHTLRYTDSAYIYGPPELRETRKLTRAEERLGDSFSLGCVFLSMLTALKGITSSRFAEYRADKGHDASFQANIPRVLAWSSRMHQSMSTRPEAQPLRFVEWMIKEEPSQRIRIRDLVPHVHDWHDSRRLAKRRSFDDLISLDTADKRPNTVKFVSSPTSQSPWHDRRDFTNTTRRAYTTT